MIFLSSFEVHMQKYSMFMKDAKNAENSHPTRIESYFEAVFHLVEAVAAKNRIHINKHQLTRNILEDSKILKEDTEKVWRAFQEIENQIRPGQIYGGAINGEALKRTEKLAAIIEEACKKLL